MSNEVILIGLLAVILGSALLVFRFGKQGLQAYIIVNSLLLYISGGILIEAFGVTLAPNGILYAGIFLASDLLTEYYGKKSGYKMVRIGLCSAILFMIIIQISLEFTPIQETAAFFGALQDVIGTSIRIFIASIIAYFLAQHFDVWFYHFLNDKTNGRFLWLRNNVSTITSQLFDTFIFFTIAFYGVTDNLLELIIIGWLVKSTVALIDTPVMYLARKIKPDDLK